MTRHYAHRMPTIQRAFGLMDNGSLVGVVTFGPPASQWVKVSMFGKEWTGELLELSRLVITTKEKNAASFLIGQALRRLPKTTALVSYADQGAGHVGYVYQATNWKYSGASSPRTDPKNDGHPRHFSGDATVRQDRSAKHRYWMCRDKAIEKACLWASISYPKGETRRHP